MAKRKLNTCEVTKNTLSDVRQARKSFPLRSKANLELTRIEEGVKAIKRRVC